MKHGPLPTSLETIDDLNRRPDLIRETLHRMNSVMDGPDYSCECFNQEGTIMDIFLKKNVYIFVFLMSLPIFIYTSYELYFLSVFRGPQMLLFSLIHGDKPIKQVHNNHVLSMATYKVILSVQVIHTALYATYDLFLS